MKTWKLKKGHDQRLRSRHPWVFSNELLDSPKSIKAGEPVEIQDINGRFIARGYGNPHSLISFRALSFTPAIENPMLPENLSAKLFKAWSLRFAMDFQLSFRLCFSEADEMPGLICDRYVFEKNGTVYQAFSYQLLTSGMDVAFKESALKIFEDLVSQANKAGFSKIGWTETLLLQRNDVNIRKLEGLQREEPVVIKGSDAVSLDDIRIQVQNVVETSDKVFFHVNLIEGQKTGFFLDQTFNMKLLIDFIQKKKNVWQGRKIKVLDLCCYMGQWSVQVVHNLKKWGLDAEVHLVDVSEMALQKATENLAPYGVDVKAYKIDVLEGLGTFPNNEFDIVISDPPAFVKNKKDIHAGLAAYTKLNTLAFKITRDDGVVVSCTCSGAVTVEDFTEALKKSVIKSGKNAKCILRGNQGWDHPTLLNFPEGFYLKMFLHQMG